ncbi:MAG TPA: hypothetical protein PLS30_10230 [Flavobacteriales bacterium]|jgi:hypothetical protein|nr:hypothetical protein [Flavobacteriales bacterium]MBK6549379.1 hypothetical protein [Flavobacteriales bacterium]MBK7100422.1 hypothetical protein [Flavobacteriales bacterium]MBK7481141.1 hypothetical protein [Flavobacteriales bacterium]MBK7617969.1 hypothetical protein [Flavobacteriales bacterium]
MKRMEHLLSFSLLIGISTSLTAQEIQFDPGNWRTDRLEQQQRSVVLLENMERVDSMFTENLATGELDLVIQRYPLARYEYYPDGAMQRRIDIGQRHVTDTMFVEQVSTGEMVMLVEKFVKDIPNGAYHEFFPNGNIRIKGTLDGYNDDGTLRKTGEWREWDADGIVIREETYE